MRFLQSERFQGLVKASLLLGTGMFLYGRIANGTLYYYINEKFAGFTLFGVLGLLVVGLAYQFGKKPGDAHDEHAHNHDNHAHAHHDHGHASHSHGLSWVGILVVALPIILGLAVPPRPLGASALENREVVLSVESSGLPASVQAAAAKAAGDRNMLDWWRSFQATSDYNTFTNQEATVIGFVYKDSRYGEGHFLATRFIVSCCVADAAVVGLVVRWPDAVALEDDQWVEVSGKFVPSPLDNWKPPLLIAESVTPVDTPAQPYLYP